MAPDLPTITCKKGACVKWTYYQNSEFAWLWKCWRGQLVFCHVLSCEPGKFQVPTTEGATLKLRSLTGRFSLEREAIGSVLGVSQSLPRRHNTASIRSLRTAFLLSDELMLYRTCSTRLPLNIMLHSVCKTERNGNGYLCMCATDLCNAAPALTPSRAQPIIALLTATLLLLTWVSDSWAPDMTGFIGCVDGSTEAGGTRTPNPFVVDSLPPAQVAGIAPWSLRTLDQFVDQPPG